MNNKNISTNTKKDKGKDFGIFLLDETNDYIVVNKPTGVLAHATGKGEKDTLADWVMEKYPEIKGVGEEEGRPGIVHRLDKEASGVMVIAKTQKMFEHLKHQFQNREVEKEYQVLVHGQVLADTGIIDFVIGRGIGGHMVARPKVDSTKLKNVGKEQIGKEAVTEFLVEKRFVRFTLLRVKIHTGRTHQIRVHMFAYGHPVVGDNLYFNKKLNRKKDKELGRLFLHAAKICFKDLEDKKVCYNSNIPKELLNFLNKLN